MTKDQIAAMLTVLYDARELLHAARKGWLRAGDRDDPFIKTLSNSVAHTEALDIPPPPYVEAGPEVHPDFAAMIENPPLNPVDHEQAK